MSNFPSSFSEKDLAELVEYFGVSRNDIKVLKMWENHILEEDEALEFIKEKTEKVK